MNEKIGIGVITCNRERFFRECANSIPRVEKMIVINDGEPYSDASYNENITKVIQHTKNQGVGKSKNQALSFLLENECEHIFLCEDDIAMQSSDVFDKYIEASYITGLKHFNFAYHGPSNKNHAGEPVPNTVIDYNGVSIGLHSYLCGAFSYYRRDVLEHVGLMDERYKNAYEHVDHTCQIIKAGYSPPFWWFPDLEYSYDLIKDLDPDLSESVIRKVGKRFYNLIVKYYGWKFKKKNGYSVEQIPKCSKKDAINSLSKICDHYGSGSIHTT